MQRAEEGTMHGRRSLENRPYLPENHGFNP